MKGLSISLLSTYSGGSVTCRSFHWETGFRGLAAFGSAGALLMHRHENPGTLYYDCHFD